MPCEHDLEVMRDTLSRKGLSHELINTLNEQQVKNIYYVVAGLVVKAKEKREENE